MSVYRKFEQDRRHVGNRILIINNARPRSMEIYDPCAGI